MNLKKSEALAVELDAKDELKDFRDLFYILKNEKENKIYFSGNSLGLMPKSAEANILAELNSWKELGVKGHSERTKWISYHREIGHLMENIVGAKRGEVVFMNSLTVNLHLLMISFYLPTPKKNKILIEKNLFSSDYFAICSQIQLKGYDPESSIIFVEPNEETLMIDLDRILELLEINGDEIALVILGGVNYQTGQVLEMEEIAKAAKEKKCFVGFDLAHAVGNVKLELNRWGVDFAVWCGYKYLNGGPGGGSGAFIHEKHHQNTDIPKLRGWWSINEKERFLMKYESNDAIDAESWQISNPPIFSLVAVKASLTIFNQVGMDSLIKKSKMLSGFLTSLLKEIASDQILITPPESQRGCQISLIMKRNGKIIFERLKKNGIICDWREPNVIRIAPVPLYNTFMDVYTFASILESSLRSLS